LYGGEFWEVFQLAMQPGCLKKGSQTALDSLLADAEQKEG